jgi:glucose-6-phosphate 1-dehydrogenase
VAAEVAMEPPASLGAMDLQAAREKVIKSFRRLDPAEVVLGQFTGYRKVPNYDRGFSLQTVVERLRAQIKAPVLTGLPFGHVPTKVLLPVGAKVEVAADGRDVFMVWGHRHPHPH